MRPGGLEVVADRAEERQRVAGRGAPTSTRNAVFAEKGEIEEQDDGALGARPGALASPRRAAAAPTKHASARPSPDAGGGRAGAGVAPRRAEDEVDLGLVVVDVGGAHRGPQRG